MTAGWEPGLQYNPGDVVEFEGHCYRNIQGHRSQGDWTPPVTPALWGKIPGGQKQQQQPCQPQQQQPCQPQQPAYPQQQPQQAPPPHYSDNDDKKSDDGDNDNWFGQHKTELGLAGGILGGAALLGGGIFAYKHHQKSEDQRKQHESGAALWIEDCRKRTEQFTQYGPRSPAAWILNKGTHIPPNAIVAGQEKTWTLYICRAYFDGGIMIGKASPVFKKGAVIGYKDEEHHVEVYEILLGNMNQLKWVRTRGRLNLDSLQARPVEGGHENDGTPLYVARASFKGAVHPGKASEKLDGAYIPYGGEEEPVNEYEVLCYA